MTSSEQSAGFSNVRGTIPKLTRLAAWILSNDFASTAFTPRYIGQRAACSREEPCPYDSPAMIRLWTPLPLFSRQRFGKVASTFSKTNSAYFGTLERYLSLAPAGIMWSVVILSPTLIIASAERFAGIASFVGGAPILGPRATGVSRSLGSGKTNIPSSTR